VSSLAGFGERATPGPSAVAAAAAATLAAALVVLQLSLLPALFPAGAIGAAAPLLPVALVAAWAAAREPIEVAPALVVAAGALGAVSTERVGWFLLALLPTVAVAVAARELPRRASWGRGRRTLERPAGREAALTDVALRAAVAAAVGAAAYLALLALASGRPALLPALGVSIAGATVWSAALATVLALLLRPRRRGLFG
jgi:hypothetical protein